MPSIREIAADVLGRAALEERFGPPRVSALDAVVLHKMAGADPELLRVAATLSPTKTLNTYEDLGGSYSAKVKE